jgi:O-antigen ligase
MPPSHRASRRHAKREPRQVNWRLHALLAFIAITCFLGGGSRHDILSLIFLRPIAIGFIGYALIVARREDLAGLPLPFYWLLALACLLGLQLVPLPYGVWASLPGRELFAQIARDAGMAEQMRPLSLTPARTWNALFSLSVPIAAFLLYAIQSVEDRRRLIRVLVIVGAASAVLGFLQTLTGADSALYWYRIHTVGKAIGFFSNRNHQAMFLAITIVMAALWISRLRADDKGASFKLVILLSFIVIIIPFLLILGSRAGVVLGVPAVLLAPWLITGSGPVRAWADRWRRRAEGRKRLVSPIALALGAYFVVAAIVVWVALSNSRREAFDRLLGPDDAALNRASVLPYLFRMARDYLPFGSGFGSFDTVFRQYEKIQELSPVYLNEAHNDWLQIVIEGGWPAVALAAAFVGWVLFRAVTAIRQRATNDPREKLAFVAVLAMIAVGSLVDYPLRVPIMMMVIAFIVSLLGDKLATPGDRWQRVTN